MLDLKLWSCTWTWWGDILVVMLTLLDTLGKSLIILCLQCSFWSFPMQCEGFWESSFSGIPAPQFYMMYSPCSTGIYTVSILSGNCIILHQPLCLYRGCQPLGHQLRCAQHPHIPVMSRDCLQISCHLSESLVQCSEHCLMPALGSEGTEWSIASSTLGQDLVKCWSSGLLLTHRHGSWSTGDPSSLPEGMSLPEGTDKSAWATMSCKVPQDWKKGVCHHHSYKILPIFCGGT